MAMTLSLLSILYFVAFSHALMITVVLFLRSSYGAPGRLLGLITALLAYKLFEGGAWYSGLYQTIPHALGLIPNMVLILGPVFYGYVRRMTGQEPFDLRTWALHMLPFLGLWLYGSSMILLPAETKIALWSGMSSAEEHQIVAPVMMAQLLAIKGILTTYLVLSWRSLSRFSERIDQLRADNSRDILTQLRFLALSFILLEAVWVSMFLAQQIFAVGTLFQVSQVWLLFTALIILAIGYRGLQKPNFLLTQEECSLAATPQQSGGLDNEGLAEVGDLNVKYLYSALPQSAAGEIAELIENAMDQDKLYLDERRTLTKLSRAIDIKSHTLSQVINQHMHTNFYRLVNGYRVQHALALIDEPGAHFSLERIAIESGFSNRVTFNKAFKAHVSCTASAYRKRARQAS
jgi:AraC-like DNA-binding protein